MLKIILCGLCAALIAGWAHAQQPGAPTRTAFPPRVIGSHGAPAPDGVMRRDVRDHGLYGEFYVPEGAQGRPALLLIGGSEGGVDTISRMATSFATQGFATLALAYWGEEGLPASLENIPLEYFDGAISWLAGQPEVNPRAIGALGWSRGAEAVLLLGSRNKAVRAVVAVSPSGLVWRGLNLRNIGASQAAWSVGGRALPFLTPGAAGYRQEDPMRTLFLSGLAAADQSRAQQIPVERINGAVLLISGTDDRLWPSERFADRIIGRLQGAAFSHPYLQLTYSGAGHEVFVGDPDGPMAQAGVPRALMGGTAAADDAAWRDDWPKTVTFLRSALLGGAR